tara:strand:- start:1237 stop:2415 length:1179 start_codon:yes stop_codon:yes gene_type:complete
MKKEVLKNISLVIFSILVAIYMLEIAYTLYNISGYKHKKWAKHKLSKYEIYMDYKNSGKDVVISISPFTFVSTINDEDGIYPLSGISNKFTIFCNESGYWSTYQSDRYGFNNPDEEWDKLHFDFVLVGDSFTLGACVREKDTIAGQLRNKSEVLNLGYGGNGPLIEYATLREYFKNIEAKNVLWLYYESDLQDFQLELSNKILINYLEDINFTQDLINKQKEIDHIASNALSQDLKNYQEKHDALFRFKEFNLKNALMLKSIRHRLSWMFGINLSNLNLISLKDDEFDYLNKFSDVLVQANNLVSNNNSKFYFVYLPTYPGVYDNINEKQKLKSYKRIINLVEKLNIPVIDLYKDLFRAHPDPESLFPSRIYGHYNEEGYKLVVKTILDKID